MRIIQSLGAKAPTSKSTYKVSYVIVECPRCGKHFEAQARSIKSLHTKSCGCARFDGSARQTTKHLRELQPRLYRIWKNMRTRCNNPNIKQAVNYSGRGITIDKNWDDFSVFYAWALQSGYQDNLSIDRINVNEGYCPQNCRWANAKTQSKNTQLLRSTNSTGYRGVTLKGKKYMARVTDSTQGVRVCLGVFITPEAAAMAHDDYITQNNLGYPLNMVKK